MNRDWPNLPKWDKRFLKLAEHIAGWSKDPSTRVGAVIATINHRIVSIGFNGFPQHVDDADERYADRDLKYKLIVHAEANALLFANRAPGGCDLFTWPFPPCSRCAGLIIQAGIARVVAPVLTGERRERWAADCELARQMFAEAGVVVTIYDDP